MRDYLQQHFNERLLKIIMAFNKKTRAIVYSMCEGHCGYCGKEITVKEMQVDHMHPKSRPGYAAYNPGAGTVNDLNNLMPTCRRCNHYKRDSTVEEFRRSMKTLHERLMKIYIVNVGVDHGMMVIEPFDGKFYFENTITPRQ